MQITELELHNFRCFEARSFFFTSPIILFEGDNGTGKTSLLEALYYLCYLRSFRTRITKELIQGPFQTPSFFVKIRLQDDAGIEQEIQVGFSAQKRLVKIDDQRIQSYKELIDRYRTIAITEDDLDLIKEGPDKRRLLLDQDILLRDPMFVQQMRSYKEVVEQRTALLVHGRPDDDTFLLWTRQLWYRSKEIQEKRIETLNCLETMVNKLFLIHFNIEHAIQFLYQSKHDLFDFKTFEDFWQEKQHVFRQEKLYKKTLFGAHLDDVTILYQKKLAKNFASRGQQKLLVVLIKIAQVLTFSNGGGGGLLFLLDDFMTDFDQEKLTILIPLLTSLPCQLIFTCPLENSLLKKLLLEKGAQIIQL